MEASITSPTFSIDDEEEATNSPASEPNSTPYAAIRRRQEELLAAKPITLEVPGFSGLLRGVYRPLSHGEMATIGDRHAKRANKKEAALLSNADFLLNASLDIEILDEKANEFRSTGMPWGRRAAAEIFGIEAATGRDAMLKIFAPPRDAAIDYHANDLVEASREPESQAEEDLVGESEAA